MKERAELSLAIARHHQNQKEIATSLLALAGVHIYDLHDLETGFALSDQSLAICQQLDNKWYLTWALQKLGEFYSTLGQPNKTFQFYQQSLNLRREIGDKIGQIDVLVVLASEYLLAGEHSEAERFILEINVLAHQIGNRNAIATGSFYLGMWWLLIQGTLQKAHDMIQSAWETANDLKNAATHVGVLGAKGFLALWEEHYSDARKFCEQASIPNAGADIVWRYMGLCYALIGLQDYSVARLTYQLTLRTARAVKRDALFVESLPITALLLSHEGNHQRATELLAFADAHPASWRGLLDTMPLVTQLRTELEIKLGIPTFAAVWEHGKTLNLNQVIEELLAEEPSTSADDDSPTK